MEERMFYYTLELQTGNTGIAAIYTFSPDEYADPKAEALSKFHNIMSFAVKGQIPHHGALVISGDGILVACQFYSKTQNEQ